MFASLIPTWLQEFENEERGTHCQSPPTDRKDSGFSGEIAEKVGGGDKEVDKWLTQKD